MFQQANSDIIKHDDLVEPGAISDYLGAELKDLVAYLPVVQVAINKMAKEATASLQGIKINNLEDVKKVNEVTKQANDLSLLNSKYKKLEAQANTALAAQRKAEITEKKAQIDLDNKIIQNKTKEENVTRKAASAYSQLTAELSKQRQVAKDLQAQIALGNKLTEEQAATLAKATSETKRLDAQVKQIDYSVGQAQRNVGNYNNQLGTLAKSVKGFGALGRILSRAIGVDPEVFNGIREAGMALKDLKHISEGAKLAKEGEAAANIANTTALQAETVAQEEEAAATAISTGGITLLIAGVLAAGYAVYELVSAYKDEQAQQEALLEIEKERTKYLEEIYKLQAKNKKEQFDADIDTQVIEGKITESMGKRIKLARDLGIAIAEAHIKEAELIKQAAQSQNVSLLPGGGVAGTNQASIDRFEQLRVQHHADANKQIEQLNAEYQVNLQKVGNETEKKDKDKEKKDTDEAARKALEAFKEDQRRKAEATKAAHEIDLAILDEAEARELNNVNLSEQGKHDIRFKYNEQRKALDEDNLKYIAEINKKEIEDETKLQESLLKEKVGPGREEFEKNQRDLAKIDEKIREEKLKQEKELQDNITKGIEEGLKTRSELQQQADQRDIDFHKRTIDVQAKLAAAGKANILGEEESKATQAEERKLQDAKKAAKQQENIALIKTFADVLNGELEKEPKGNFLQAFSKAIAAVGASEAVFAKLFSGSAYEGTEDTGSAGNLDSKGGKAWILHPNEGVVNAEGKKEVPGLVTAINEGGLAGVQAWAFENIYKPQFKASNVSTAQKEEQSTDAVLAMAITKELRELKQEIANKPTQQIEIDGLREILETVQSGSMTKKIHHKVSTKRPSLRLHG